MAKRKKITTKKELELDNLINFSGIYVDSLKKSAKRFLGIPQKKQETIASLLREVKRRRKAELKFQAQQFKLSVKKHAQLKEKARSILESFRTGHSMGCYRTLCIGERIFAESHYLDTYSRSCTWKPTYGDITITMSKKDLQYIENIEGLWTIKMADGSAKWLEANGKKSTYHVTFVHGYIYKDTHSTVSLAHARELQTLKDEASKIDALKFVGIKHIKRTGACDAGIKAFIRKHNLNSEFGYRLDYLKSLDKDNNFLSKL